MSKNRSYVFTLNHYTKEEEEHIKQLDCKYLVFGREIGEKCKTPHLQGFITFKSPIIFKSAKKRLGDRCHIEVAVTIQRAINYCKEDGDYFEKGEKPQPGKRNDVHKIREIAKKEDVTLEEIADNSSNLQTLKYGERLAQIYRNARKRTWKPEVIWHYGPAGSGKTRAAFSENRDAFFKENENWNGYAGHKTVIWDDFRTTDCRLNQLLKWIDRYPCQVNVKYGSEQLLFTKIIFTSPDHPNTLSYENEDIQQLLRRIDDIIFFKGGD